MLVCLVPTCVAGKIATDPLTPVMYNIRDHDPMENVREEQNKLQVVQTQARCSNLLSNYHQGDLADGVCFSCRAVQTLKTKRACHICEHLFEPTEMFDDVAMYALSVCKKCSRRIIVEQIERDFNERR